MANKIGQILFKLKNFSLLKHAGLYMFFNIIDKAMPFLVMPIIARHISVNDMGLYTLFQAIYGFVLPLLTLQADSGIMINHYHMAKEEFKKYFSSGLCVFVLSFLSVCLITFLFASVIEKYLDFDIVFLYLTYITGFFYFFNRVNLNIWQKEKEPVKYGVFIVLLSVFKNLLMLYFVFYHPEYSWKGIVISQGIAQFIFFLYSFYFLFVRGLINLNVEKKYMKDVFKIGGPITVYQLGVWSSDVGARIIISILIGASAAAHYGIASTFGMLMLIVQNSFHVAIVPFLYEKMKGIEAKENNFVDKLQIVKLNYLYILILIGISLVISLLGYFTVSYIFGVNYVEAKSFIFWIVLGAALGGIYKINIEYMFFNKKTNGVALITIITGVLNLLLCILFIKMNGGKPIGAAYALVISRVITFILCWMLSNKVYPLPWFNFRIFKSFSKSKELDY